MDFLTALKISSSALSAERLRIDVISSNLANVNTTRTPGGGPYRRQEVVFASQPVTNSFDEVLASEEDRYLKGVEVVDIATDGRPPKMVYDPRHPDANAQGYVGLPDINGYEVAHARPEDAQTKDLRLIALTGYATPEHRDRALAWPR